MVLMYPADRHLTLMWKYEEVRSLRIAAAFCRISKSTAQRWIKQHTTPIEKKVLALCANGRFAATATPLF